MNVLVGHPEWWREADDDSEASARDARADADGPHWQFVGVARYGGSRHTLPETRR